MKAKIIKLAEDYVEDVKRGTCVTVEYVGRIFKNQFIDKHINKVHFKYRKIYRYPLIVA